MDLPKRPEVETRPEGSSAYSVTSATVGKGVTQSLTESLGSPPSMPPIRKEILARRVSSQHIFQGPLTRRVLRGLRIREVIRQIFDDDESPGVSTNEQPGFPK